MTPASSNRLSSARRDLVVLAILITAVMMLIWNGSAFFNHLHINEQEFGAVRVASTALTLNVALILFGWRRYVDLQHEAEMRAEQELRAAILATTDATTGLFNRRGFADRADQLALEAR
jgi:membrane protein implicated in regulation of membrane protease activity